VTTELQKNICFVTGSRAEFGSIAGLIQAVSDHKEMASQLIVTGAHLSPRFGNTVDEIVAGGFVADELVDLDLQGDSPLETIEYLSRATSGIGAALQRLNPDLVFLSGDRYEMLAAAQAALILNLPIAHLFGGDTTEGAFDEAFRHSISKMAHLHFATNRHSGRRLVQLGENPNIIHVVGSPAIDQIQSTELLSRSALEEGLGWKLRQKNLLVTFHPATLSKDPGEEISAFLAALAELDKSIGIIITRANADPSGQVYNQAFEVFVEPRDQVILRDSLGQQRYYSAVAEVDAVVGNSSSGLYEAPALGTPTVNIGNRQKGRLRGRSVVDCSAQTPAIASAIQQVLAGEINLFENLFGDGQSIPAIVAKLAETKDFTSMLTKEFFDLDNQHFTGSTS
jgi:UDP-hydrolysing UDP-N-acetyl-D-glucosamine 2-epimerase